MKTVKLFFFAMLLFIGSNIYAQGNSGGECSNIISKYNGPRNSQQLSKLLNESKDPALVNLSAATKASLIEFMIFDKGRPAGMLNTDRNIDALYSDPIQATAVFSAIFGAPTLFVTDATKPAVVHISMKDFMDQYNSDPLRYAVSGVPTWCYNCYSKNLDPCCEVGGKGCWDEYTMSARVLYKVHP